MRTVSEIEIARDKCLLVSPSVGGDDIVRCLAQSDVARVGRPFSPYRVAA